MPLPDTILIVDDDPETRDAMRSLLEDEGYRVATVNDGREALRVLLAGLSPCVIVMDMVMPTMDGVAFRTEQLKHPSIAAIPFIAYSGVIDVRRAAEQVGAAGYIEKPREFQYVLSIIRQHCKH